ncbi:MAG: hypothetical protein JNJ54_35950 [Myxococcaceae bacterium]|nr:hypothetical protein [Myxococcaceae bacterium]
MAFLDDLHAFAAAHGLTVKGKALAHEFVLEGGTTERRVTMAQGSILAPRGGGKLFHFRLTFEPWAIEPSWLLTPQGATRWDAAAPSPVRPEDVPGFSRFGAPLAEFGAEVKTHWQLKLGEQNRLYLEALALVSARAWALAWQVLEAAWAGSATG